MNFTYDFCYVLATEFEFIDKLLGIRTGQPNVLVSSAIEYAGVGIKETLDRPATDWIDH